MSRRPPTLHVLAGPNGAGKSTLYETRIKDIYRNAAFVNADLLAREHYGHNATTLEESQKGQALADARRAELMAQRKDLVTESTFSHPSKLDLIRDAQQRGYRVQLYHVNVRSPELSVKRVAARVDQGGHPVPEDKIRERYDRNQALIHAAAMLADKAIVFDNSLYATPPRDVIRLEKGVVTAVGRNVPAWARELYAEQIKGYSLSRLNPSAHSFAEAKDLAAKIGGPEARVVIGKRGQSHRGTIVAESSLHYVQQMTPHRFVAHFKRAVPPDVRVGQKVQIDYKGDKANAKTIKPLLAERNNTLDPRANLMPRYAAALDELRAQRREAKRIPGAAVQLSAEARADLIAGADSIMALKAPGLEQQKHNATLVAMALAAIDGPEAANPFKSPGLTEAYERQQQHAAARSRKADFDR